MIDANRNYKDKGLKRELVVPKFLISKSINNQSTGELIRKAADASVIEESSFLNEEITYMIINYYYSTHRILLILT